MSSFKVPQNRKVLNYLMVGCAEDLSEAATTLAREISEGRYEEDGDLSLRVALAHLMDHVVTIWHQSRMTDQDNEKQGQAEFEAMCLSIPRLQDGYEIVDAD